MKELKPGNWLADLVEVYNELGGQASYTDVYELCRRRRTTLGSSWTAQSPATIRRKVEDHAESSSNFRGDAVFYSVNGHGNGTWALLPEYVRADSIPLEKGIIQERRYLLRSRDAKLVEARKVKDDYTCQTCGLRLEVSSGKFIIEVHHLKPVGELSEATVTSIDDLICLCPTCHRVAHSKPGSPVLPDAIRVIISGSVKGTS